MAFNKGDQVQSKTDPTRIGIIQGIGPLHAGLQYYSVFWGDNTGTKMVSEIDLHSYTAHTSPKDNLLSGNIAGYRECQRLITYHRLAREFPLRNNIYAFNASRTRFYPYQFKPLMKFLESPGQRLLICDEVGLGKTIEAGLILTELRARQDIQRVLVVCPANLCSKWKMELKKRFGEEFRIYRSGEFTQFLEEYQNDPDYAKLEGIISIETIRRDEILDALETTTPSLDLLVIDEAHYMRNLGRKQRRAGVVLSECATAMLMLTATPIHLGNINLFSLLNVLDDEDFPDPETAEVRFQQNKPIVKAQICLGQIPPKLSEANTFLKQARQSEWIQKNPLYNDVVERIHNAKETTQSKSSLINLQRDVADLNLLSHIYTRTKKRDVHGLSTRRKAFSLEVTLTPLELRFYQAVTNFIRQKSKMKGASELIQHWMLHMPQRRVASSIPAMVLYYKQNLGFDLSEFEEDANILGLEGNINDKDFVAYAQTELREIVRTWPQDATDSKYERFLSMLRELRATGPCKIIVFAFFKDTLNYLKQRSKSDGFESVLISGDIPPDIRFEMIERFRTDPRTEIMFSSRVGSEGLDFQFSNIMFNYDLPWNPMEVEQRIGRIDRIGQESPIIRIYNLWVKDTIEERMLRRLYDRIHIFEESIGELEDILGETISQFERDIFRSQLTPTEQDDQRERIILAIEAKKRELEELEAGAAKFIGTDKYFEDEVEQIRFRRRYVTGVQLKHFLTDFIKSSASGTRLVPGSKQSKYFLYPDDKLKSFLIKHHKATELPGFFNDNAEIEITFDSDLAFANPGLEFINVLHPLITSIVQEYGKGDWNHISAHHVLLKSELIQSGFYFYYVFRVRSWAALGRNTLECIMVDGHLQQVVDMETSEAVLGEMVERGRDPKGASIAIEPDLIERAYEKIQKYFLEHLKGLRLDLEKRNNAFIDRRLASLNTSYEKTIGKKNNLLKRAERDKRQERYIRMLKGTVNRLERELKERTDELEKKRGVEVEYDEVAGGVLEVD